MAGNSITPSTADNSTDKAQKSTGNSMSAATYYGAIVIVVFLLIALAIVVRIVYAKKYKQRNPEIDEPTSDTREREERLAMERRGEEVGLPTYRESVLLPDTVLAATPMSDEPFLQPRPSTSETLPNQGANAQMTHLEVVPPVDDDNFQPPKYEVDPTEPDPNISTTLSPTNHEMRMSSQSATTLVLPSITTNQPQEDPPASIDQRSTTPSLPPSDSNVHTNTSNQS